ncbi:cellulose binding domain-containing protein [Nonomuraea basaltis]|uniref:cellulose binding domain-containing protein n=1 Tax=Nonomuraea basaltis TaxID=2495887 RepID=UPI00110C48FE|nr:cellulose binding domain-containing protein [Nonomuraea basaltis]TMR92011.1 hypothetical protein EJK15_46895 [Nonomuraea basaltis]
MKHCAILLAFANFALSLIGPPAQAAAATATFVKVADWGSGFDGKVTVSNGTFTAMTDWNVRLDAPASISIPCAWTWS